MAVIVLLGMVGTAAGHGGGGDAIDVERWYLAWSWQPLPLIGVLAAAAVYGCGVRRLWRRAGAGRGISRLQVGCFGAAMALLLLALVSPIDTLAEHLNWVHMVQHKLLMLVAAPLIAAASPAVAAAWALPERWGRRVGRASNRYHLPMASRYLLWQPLGVWLLFAGIVWVWHLPSLYDLALRHQLVHDLQHLAFVVGAVLYWRVVLDPLGRVRLTPLVAMGYLFTMSLQGMFLGVFMAFSPRAWYAEYAQTTAAFGLSPLEDQQLAGYMMWKPGCAIFAFIAIGIFATWLHRSLQRDEGGGGVGDVERRSLIAR